MRKEITDARHDGKPLTLEQLRWLAFEAEKILASQGAIKIQLRDAIASHEEYGKKVNDTGTMWREETYRTVLKEIERLEALP